MRGYRLPLSLAAVAVAVAVGHTQPGDPAALPADEPAATEAEAKALQAVDDLATAGRMIELGRRTKTPETLIAAALVLHRTPAAEAKHEFDTAPAGDERAALLDEAAKMRPQDQPLQAGVAAARERVAEKERGADVGARTYTGLRIAAGKQTFGLHGFTGSCKATLRVTAAEPAYRPRGFFLVEPSFAKLEILDEKGKVHAREGYIPLGGVGTVGWNAGPKRGMYTLLMTNVSPAGVGQPKGVGIVCTLAHN